MDFNEIITNTGIWVWVIIGLLALWVIGGLPSAVKNWARKKGRPMPAWYEDHIVLIEIVWICLLVFLAYRYSPV